MNITYNKMLNNYMDKLDSSPIFWKTDVLSEWFESVLCLKQYVNILKKKKISGKKFDSLINENRLDRLDIIKIGHKKLAIQLWRKMIDKFPEVDFQLNHLKRSSRSSPMLMIGKEMNTLTSSPNTNNNNNNNEFISIKSNSLEEQMNCKILVTKSYTQEQISKWRNQEVKEWLGKIGFESFADLFEVNHIFGDILLDLKEDILREMGITSFASIRRFIHCLRYLCPSHFQSKKSAAIKIKSNLMTINEGMSISPSSMSPKTPSPISSPLNSPKTRENIQKWDSVQVSQWIYSKGYGSYSKLFKENEINGEILGSLEDRDLKEIGISSSKDRTSIVKKIKELNKGRISFPSLKTTSLFKNN